MRQLEPPEFLGLHYGIRTALSVLIAHAVFGAILGAFTSSNKTLQRVPICAASHGCSF